jgi:hypothetical protein
MILTTFNSHIQSITKACNFHLKAFRRIRSSIDLETTKSVACSIIGSRLDYADFVLQSVSLSNLAKLLRVQYATARIVIQSHLDTDLLKHCIGFQSISESF